MTLFPSEIPLQTESPLPATGRRSRRRSRRRPQWLILFGRAGLLLLYGVPLAWVVVTSLKSQSDVLSGDALLIFAPTAIAYQDALANPALPNALLQSLIIALGTMTLVMALAVPLAYALAKVRGLVAGLVLGGLIFLQMIPQSAGVVSLYAMFASVRLTDSTLGLIIANAAGLVPWATVLLRPFFLAVPAAIEEAAALDGAGTIRTFVRVVLPITRNGLATVASIMFFVSWGEFVNAITLLISPDKYPIAALIAQQTSGYGVNWPGLMSLAVILSVPLLIVYVLSFRLLRDGIAVGAVK